ncbi:MAG: exodeoxyribonuclease VII large subunit [Microthrixaceae bacterium]
MDAPTWSVGELHEAVNGLLDHVFEGGAWVEGEVRNLTRARSGHVYFDLVDGDHDGHDATRPKLAVTLFQSNKERVNESLRAAGGAVRMTDGVRLRIGGRLGTYPARSTLQLVMDRIDPAFTLGVLGQDRARLLRALEDDGLLRANAGAHLTALPLHVALVTARGSAAQADALDELRRSGFAFRVRFLDARTQGPEAEGELVAALHTAAALGVDVVLLVRGGGAATDLAAFDGERLARAIAASPVPVVTGIGHETDRSVADEVAHTAHKTPTAAAGALVRAVERARAEVHDRAAAVAAATSGRLARARRDLERHAHRCGSAAGRSLDHAALRVAHATDRVAGAAPRALALGAERLDGLAARAHAHDPAVALARGWSITRRADGTVVRRVAEVGAGDVLRTTVADGAIESVVAAEPDPTG